MLRSEVNAPPRFRLGLNSPILASANLTTEQQRHQDRRGSITYERCGCAIPPFIPAIVLFAVLSLIGGVSRADDKVASLRFETQPTNTGVGMVINPAVAVVALKKNGAAARFAAVQIGLVPIPSSPGLLSGTLTRHTNHDGVATFKDLKVDWLGNGYRLIAQTPAADGALSATSDPFNELRVGDACLGPDTPACQGTCADGDGDGLNDAWEIAGGVDLNGDGVIDAHHDLLLPGANPNKPDIYIYYDWMDYGTLDYACTAGRAHHGRRAE